MKTELTKRILSSIVLLPTAFFLIIYSNLSFNLFIIICLFFTFYEWNKMSKNKNYGALGFLFLTFSFFTIYKLRNDVGVEIILFILSICISTDIGGYAFGKIFKGPKLTKISPKKTYAGTVGGFLLSILVSIIFLIITKFNLFNEFSIKIFIIILLISIVSQLGDILISYFKRLSNIKHTGKLIPGHGGILDRIDGMIFAFPFSYILFQINLF